MTCFVYCPKSGDRLFAQNTSQNTYVAVVVWGNGCRHVFGGHHLSYTTATPGRYWRLEAHRMASMLVARYGGIAWDAQGEVNIVVPLQNALESHRQMKAVERWARAAESSTEPDDNATGMLMAGWEPSSDMIFPSWLPQTAISSIVGIRVTASTRWRASMEEGEANGKWVDVWQVIVTSRDSQGGDMEIVQTAPLDWNVPAISPPDLLRTEATAVEA